MDKIRRSRIGRPSKFDEVFKRKVVLDYHHGRETLRAVALRYQVSRTTISTWIDAYEQERQQLLTLGVMEAENTGAADAGDHTGKAPDAGEFKALQEELRLARIKLACLETLIDITERDLGIDIRKKAGTRSSAE
jgi:transposase-like protein